MENIYFKGINNKKGEIMISFGKFSDILDTEKQIKECAYLMSHSKDEPEKLVENVLENDLVESWKDWFSGAARTAKAGAQIAGSVVSGGLAHGFSRAGDTTSGPAKKFDDAVKILKELEQLLRTNPATKGKPSSSMPKRSIAGYIQAIYQALEKESANMPVMQGASKQMATGQKYALRGGATPNRSATPQSQQQQRPQQQSQSNPEGMTIDPPMRLAQ